MLKKVQYLSGLDSTCPRKSFSRLREAMKAGWIAAVCVWLCADRMLAQNLNNFDVQEPVLRFSPAAGQDEDLFGYAVTAHQIETLDAALTDPADIMQDALAKTR